MRRGVLCRDTAFRGFLWQATVSLTFPCGKCGLLMKGMCEAQFGLSGQELQSTPDMDGAQEVQKE